MQYLLSYYGLLAMPDIDSEEKVFVIDSPLLSPCSLVAIESDKVKFIPTEGAGMLSPEATLKVYNMRGRLQTMLSSEAEARAYNTRGNSHASLTPKEKTRAYYTRRSRRVSIHQTTEATLMVPSILQNQTANEHNSGSVTFSDEKHVSLSKYNKTVETVTNNNKGRTLQHEAAGKVVNFDNQLKEPCYQAPVPPFPLLILPDWKPLNCPSLEACWKGTFDISEDMGFNLSCGVQAHLPFHLCYKSYDYMKQMAENLNVKLSPRLLLWPSIFQLDPPDHQDVALYFLPSKQERSQEKYKRLLEHMNLHDFALQSCIGDVKLLIYSSKQLPKDSTRIVVDAYLWGVFQVVSNDFTHISQEQPPSDIDIASTNNPGGEPSASLESNSMEIDTLKDRDNTNIDGCRLVTPGNSQSISRYDGKRSATACRFSEVISVDVAHGKRRATSCAVEGASSVILNSPPGFSKLIPRDVEDGKKCNAGFSLKEKTSPLIVDVPPGFSKAVSKSAILLKETTAVIPSIPPGFSRTLALRSKSNPSKATNQVHNDPEELNELDSSISCPVGRIPVDGKVKEETETQEWTNMTAPPSVWGIKKEVK